jgi:hypothetical protein
MAVKPEVPLVVLSDRDFERLRRPQLNSWRHRIVCTPLILPEQVRKRMHVQIEAQSGPVMVNGVPHRLFGHVSRKYIQGNRRTGRVRVMLYAPLLVPFRAEDIERLRQQQYVMG